MTHNFSINPHQVHLTDLLSALSYMLRHEIPMKQQFSGDNYDRLDEFIKLLAQVNLIRVNYS